MHVCSVDKRVMLSIARREILVSVYNLTAVSINFAVFWAVTDQKLKLLRLFSMQKTSFTLKEVAKGFYFSEALVLNLLSYKLSLSKTQKFSIKHRTSK